MRERGSELNLNNLYLQNQVQKNVGTWLKCYLFSDCCTLQIVQSLYFVRQLPKLYGSRCVQKSLYTLWHYNSGIRMYHKHIFSNNNLKKKTIDTKYIILCVQFPLPQNVFALKLENINQVNIVPAPHW